MKGLKEYIKEGLFDDLDKRESIGGLEAAAEDIKNEIYNWIIKNNNYRTYKSKIKIDTTTTPWTVNYDGDIQLEPSITSLTNGGIFQWGEVKGSFYCSNCNNLKSLEGSPKVVDYFYCNSCTSLTSLEGCPKEVKQFFNCSRCYSLKTLEGAPKKVVNLFDCAYCTNLTSLKGAPEVVIHFDCLGCQSIKTLEGAPEKVGRDFRCQRCTNLTSLKGAPKEVGGWFDCTDCGVKFTKEDVKKVSKVKREIYC